VEKSLPAGDPELAQHICAETGKPQIHLDNEMWRLDHGTWSVLKHMYPTANIPVVQLSIYMAQPPEYHVAVGQQIKKLRNEDVLIIGSGNIVHNLGKVDFTDNAKPFDWAVEYDLWVKQKLEDRDFSSLTYNATDTTAGKLSIPSPDHWYPLLYTLGAADDNDELRFEYEGIENSSISMRCLSFGR
jgi:4,5-DOPA dioxygenase extradiol